ncbi:unnamed protein product [Didymodactylos carnosus]|uniref:Uncharacterized protein n=1 Tax=Didymodactylos carnosus TaxID=1234261 RepID=A0A814M4F5_9BILA|nr:unnamed protein product [Didymodactylos carnosus]CAF1521483.1 unnamed protein product [Didymodactylos carnosus]CAF3841119.1 unnamed protein product [Didymodactylos carnosus]CAF4308383.1 unnamed protein product [Didymodactylos carnosus]
MASISDDDEAGDKPSFLPFVRKKDTWPSSDQDIVPHLINLQKFDGLWILSDEEIQKLCKKPLSSFHPDTSTDPIVLTSALVIAVLETKFVLFKPMWSFIVNKGRKRLTELLGDTQKLEQLMESENVSNSIQLTEINDLFS